MNPREAVDLARYMRAHFPSQPVDEFTADALAETLVEYPPADCRAAVLNLADRGEQWCAPTAIKAEVKRIREKRVADYGPIEPPAGLDPDDTRGYARWLAGATKAIADGTVTAPQPLPRGDRNVIAELGQIGKPVPNLRALIQKPERRPEPAPLTRPQDRLREPEPNSAAVVARETEEN